MSPLMSRPTVRPLCMACGEHQQLPAGVPLTVATVTAGAGALAGGVDLFEGAWGRWGKTAEVF